MADKNVLDRDHRSATVAATDFSHSLISDGGSFPVDGVNGDYTFGFSSPQMLSFRNFQNTEISCGESSSTSSSNKCCINALPLPSEKRTWSEQDSGTVAIAVALAPKQRTSKKIKADNPTSTGHAKRKEKLGERVATLQQLVSPFGKTDTASVLHEAMGYIKFLHEQVQVLCYPYFQNLPFLSGSRDKEVEAKERNLRSRGLCLIPVESTLTMANNNGADLWSPGMRKNNFIIERH